MRSRTQISFATYAAGDSFTILPTLIESKIVIFSPNIWIFYLQIDKSRRILPKNVVIVENWFQSHNFELNWLVLLLDTWLSVVLSTAYGNLTYLSHWCNLWYSLPRFYQYNSKHPGRLLSRWLCSAPKLSKNRTMGVKYFFSWCFSGSWTNYSLRICWNCSNWRWIYQMILRIRFLDCLPSSTLRRGRPRICIEAEQIRQESHSKSHFQFRCKVELKSIFRSFSNHSKSTWKHSSFISLGYLHLTIKEIVKLAEGGIPLLASHI